MNKGFIYWHPIIYRIAMHILYGKNDYLRYQIIADLLPNDVSVVDICCGDCFINNFLKEKNIDYIGLDLNPCFIKYAQRKGINAKIMNINDNGCVIPSADYIIIQSALYHFIPNHKKIIDNMLHSAKKGIIIAEPVKNIILSKAHLINSLAKFATMIHGRVPLYRFTKESLLDLFYEYNVKLIKELPGGRDLIGLFIK